MDRMKNKVEAKNRLNEVWSKIFSRRTFLKLTGLGLLTLIFSSVSLKKALAKNTQKIKPRPRKKISTNYDLVAVKGEDPTKITRQAVESLGGMKKFVKTGDTVVIKPNIGWDRSPEQAGNTNPYVVGVLVKMCREAGAKRVRVFDHTCNEAQRTYQNSGIAEAVKKSGGEISYIEDWRFRPGEFPPGSPLVDWPIYSEAVKCDCFINVPVAKHHGLSKLTLSMKNLMGICGGSRGTMHFNLERKLAEVTAFINPELTVIDAYRVLLRHGPTGGNLEDVEQKNTVIASPDPVLADAYAATLFGLQPEEIGYIVEGAKLSLGNMDLKKSKIKIVES